MDTMETTDTMDRGITFYPIARIQNDFQEKFGIPRQSGLTEAVSQIVFEPEYRVAQAFRGIEGYSHLWLIWEFSEAVRENWSPTVRPPRLGGNKRVGVFATRSPFRPNPVGLSCVRLESVDLETEKGPVLYVSGADLLDGTPIYDIKPYLPYVDAHPEAEGGFAEEVRGYALQVEIPGDCKEKLRKKMTERQCRVLRQILEQDPRPSYQNDPERIYGMKYAGTDVKFRVDGETLIVCDIE